MIEVVFSDSAKGSMRIANGYHKENVDVVCIGHNLDMGDIAGEFDSEKRKKEFNRALGIVTFCNDEIARFFDLLRKDFDKMLVAAKSGERIRVWKSNAPFSACGFAFLCDALRDIDCKVGVVALPEYWETAENTIGTYTDWGELPPGQFYRFLHLEHELSAGEKHWQGSLWHELKSENAPLRALVNGKLMSVPEDFYDHILIKHIPDGEFVVARLIGTVLGKYPLGVGDGWYALRIQKMIADGTLEMIGDNDASHPYGKVLRKVYR